MRVLAVAPAVPFSGPSRGDERERVMALSRPTLTPGHVVIEFDTPVAV